MKKRIFIGVVTSVFAIAIFFNANSTDMIGNVSLSDIETMAQASCESDDYCNCDHQTQGMCYCRGFQPYEERCW
jgi:hypothetical protein